MSLLGTYARRSALLALTIAAAFTASIATAGDKINKDARDVAILGYDPVAYFTESRAVQGSAAFEYIWQDARWWFADAEHRDLFAGDPDHYAPRFGGFCTGGVGLGRLSPIDPEAWVIVDGQLYLHYDKAARDKTVASPAERIAAAEEKWGVLSGNR